MPHRGLLRLAVLAAAVVLGGIAARHAAPVAATGASGYPQAGAASPGATFTFAPGVTPINQHAFLAAVAHARPEAARLIDRVDGLVRVEDAPAPDGALGITIADGRGYTVRLAFGAVFRELGQRGFDRVVQHELGHVVDFAMVGDDLGRRLDAGIPPGQPCVAGASTGSCAPVAERFAESFAKWASGDIGVNLYAGYAVPPPPDLEAWGRPLAALASG